MNGGVQAGPRERRVDVERLLERTSRTFALSIPLLPEPTRRQVGLAYLLFRIADTFEDATRWSGTEQRRALEEFVGLMDRPGSDEARALAEKWTADPPVDHAGYRELLAQSPAVLRALQSLAPEAQEAIRRHVIWTAEGMSGFVDRTDRDGVLRLQGLQDLRDYCYVVAGIVGEMLTELFLLGRDRLAGAAGNLRRWAPRFGEGLQLTNILKDAGVDALEGRLFLPRAMDRGEVLALARQDLDIAAEYTLLLQEAGAERGVVAFNALPVALARATLEKVEREGPGSKVTRWELWAIVDRVQGALDRGRPPLERSPAAHRVS